MLPALNAWMRGVDETVAKEQVRTGLFFNGAVMNESTIQSVKDSLERGNPRPYYGMIGGAYAYIFIPTSIGCVAKVKNTETGDEIDLTPYDAW